MTRAERRASLTLAALSALRMLGFFLVLPVFVLGAGQYSGGSDAALVGLAMGIYGLTQALLQLPLGLASDRLGRKPVIVLGLCVFAAGSLVAALAESVWGLMLGRALQGAGAISAAITALLADQTRDAVRTKAMALMGISIGMSFCIALVLGPLLYAWIGLPGLFWLILGLSLASIALVLVAVPARASRAPEPETAPVWAGQAVPEVQRRSALRRLYAGVFILHCVQMALWSAVPHLLRQAGLAGEQHWLVYLPAIVASAVFFGAVFALERRGHSRLAVLVGIGLMALAQAVLLALAWAGFTAGTGVLWLLGLALFVFFCGFNALEAMQPSQVSRLATPAQRGKAMGLYATLQSLGLFTGGALGGWVMAHWQAPGLLATALALTLLWLAVGLGQRR